MRHTTLAAAVTLLAAPRSRPRPRLKSRMISPTIVRPAVPDLQRPAARPTWMDEVHPREAYKALTLDAALRVAVLGGRSRPTGDCQL